MQSSVSGSVDSSQGKGLPITGFRQYLMLKEQSSVQSVETHEKEFDIKTPTTPTGGFISDRTEKNYDTQVIQSVL